MRTRTEVIKVRAEGSLLVIYGRLHVAANLQTLEEIQESRISQLKSLLTSVYAEVQRDLHSPPPGLEAVAARALEGITAALHGASFYAPQHLHEDGEYALLVAEALERGTHARVYVAAAESILSSGGEAAVKEYLEWRPAQVAEVFRPNLLLLCFAGTCDRRAVDDRYARG